MKLRKLFCAALLMAAAAAPALADEGMWLVNMIEGKLHKQMAAAGLKLKSNVLYDENNVSLSDAVVSLAFGCSGSMISNDGLMITNHHCAYGDLHALSTPEHNYLEDGFCALQRKDEMPVHSEGIYFLKKVVDITDEVQHLRDSFQVEKRPMAMRRVYAVIESKYQKIYEGQGEVICTSYWSGQRYMIALYEVYKDVRLVAAPPVCMASFGAEVDNWEWPQQKCDFTIYRIYTAPDGSPAEYSPDNVPLHPKRVLTINAGGLHDGDFVMVMGYPGRTDRYASSFAVHNTASQVNPVQAFYRKEQMKIIDKWSNLDPKVRLLYADRYFMLSNVQEIREGEIYCYNRFDVPAIKRRTQEEPLQAWIDADPERKAQWGTLIPDLEKKYKDLEWINQQINYYRETLVNGYRLGRVSSTVTRTAAKAGAPEVVIADSASVMRQMERNYSQIDLRVEREIFDFSLREYFNHVDRQFWGTFLQGLYDQFEGNAAAISEYLWSNSIYSDEARLRATLAEAHTPEFYAQDPLQQMFASVSMLAFNKVRDEIEAGQSLSQAETKYKRVLYKMRLDKGEVQYADANSTMRLTYGKVGPISPRDAVTVASRTSVEGILEKYNPDEYIFTLKPEILALYQKGDWGRWGEKGKLYANFLGNCDITGGNSGSPVFDARGRLVGLAFDGNKEGLAGDTYFDPQMNKTISVDIRFVLWTLDKYMHADAVLAELDIVTK